MPVVIIKMGAGRTVEQKRRVADEITRTITTTFGVDPSWVTIFFDELDRESIAKSGRLLCDG
ncbi:MAG: 4-oxalocrotonate tautomerase family protein [Methanomicrobiales archaeon]|jgi:4-oxalocrotonate tautomerase|nr:4-oxalocrotonate tautomerase [Methanomicrobia archaeon]MDD1634505.1 4-oxalocrotonate tautomerase family protein [Methanomicrobiales archaeon]MDD1639031.1 4-oxalocrotonate tautomerase family protein [Methanomicrobiales archaeon]MDD1645566.1 4-oxalocrotonate tautomerase family protein [Methanomicrobiales archaeon]MDD1646281.1 4-oxalocrotonate tautomerase family protein [Methanomicrobiales archaeon]